MGERRSSVITAGLVGAASLAFATPELARAASISQIIDEALVSPTVALVVGVAGGAAVSGAAIAAASVALRAREQEEPAATPARPPRHMRAEAEPSAERKPSRGPSHAATNYEEIAENYVGRATFRERMARRAEGVAATLRERMRARLARFVR